MCPWLGDSSFFNSFTLKIPFPIIEFLELKRGKIKNEIAMFGNDL